jgi:O-antigen ligase
MTTRGNPASAITALRMGRTRASWAPLVYPLVAATAALVGLLAVRELAALLVLTFAVVVLLVLTAILSRAGIKQLRATDLMVMTTVVYLALAPFLTSYGTIFSALRFVLAAMVSALILLRQIPLREHAMRNGGWLVLAFAAYQLIPLFSEGATSYGILRFLNWIMFVPLAFVRYDRQSAKFAFGAVVVTSLVLFGGILLQKQGVMGGVWGGESNGDLLNPTYAQRYTSFLGNPNDLGLFMLCTVLFSYLYAVHVGTEVKSRIVATVVTLIAVYSMFLASSRGAFLALPLALVFFFLMGAKRTLIIALAAVAFVLLIVDPLIPSVRTSTAAAVASVERITAGDDVSSSARLTIWTQRLSHSGNITLGTGYGGYAVGAKVADSRTNERQQLYQQLTVDNGWLKLWLEEGIVGLLLFAGILGYLVRNGVRSRAGSFAGLIGLMTAGAAVAMIFRNFSADIFDINPWNAHIWILFGMAASFAVVTNERGIQPKVDVTTQPVTPK